MKIKIDTVPEDVGRESAVQQRVHLNYLDGLRGLAALYVVVYHAYAGNEGLRHDKNIPSWLYHLLGLVSFGQAAVAVFIVLSGYCLMMPLVWSNTVTLRDGTGNYLKRRAKRILPPYYAAAVVSLVLMAIVPGMDKTTVGGWGASLPAFRWDILLSHVFLVHNLSYNWSHKIDYPMWSVATEWQIYFIFPLILLPVWRRFGILAAIGVALAAGIVPHWLFHGQVDGAEFEFIGLFAFGMAGAVCSFSSRDEYVKLRLHIPWSILALVLLIPIAYFAKFRGNWDWSHSTLNNITVGLATTCLLVYCAETLSVKKQNSLPMVVKMLRAGPCVALGTFSYSLYLIHAPVIALVALAAEHFHVSSVLTLALSLTVAVPLSVLVSYLFFLAIEKPFLVRRKEATPAEVARDTALSPAP